MTPMKDFYEKQAGTLIHHLEKRGMEGYYCEDCSAAVQKVISMIPEGSTVTWGGTMTLEESGVKDALQTASVTLIDRDKAETKEERLRLIRQAFSADYYFMSCNAITLDGQLVNIDGTGNRVAALCYGPEHVILLVGMNKIVKTAEEAIDRAHNVAAPPNAIRLDMKTPCSKTGVCADCLSPDCICAQTVITRYNRIPGRIKVILIGEPLGF